MVGRAPAAVGLDDVDLGAVGHVHLALLGAPPERDRRRMLEEDHGLRHGAPPDRGRERALEIPRLLVGHPPEVHQVRAAAHSGRVLRRRFLVLLVAAVTFVAWNSAFWARWRSGGTARRSSSARRSSGRCSRCCCCTPARRCRRERLVDALWGEQPPAGRSRRSRSTSRSCARRSASGVVETRPLGYVAQLDDGALDLQRFERSARRGPAPARRGRRRSEAAAVLREALALWRGEPLADFRYEAFARQRDRAAGGAAPDRARAAARGRPRRSAATPRPCPSSRRSCASIRCARACAGC